MAILLLPEEEFLDDRALSFLFKAGSLCNLVTGKKYNTIGSYLPEIRKTYGIPHINGAVLTNYQFALTEIKPSKEYTVFAVVIDSLGRGSETRNPIDADNFGYGGDRIFQLRVDASNVIQFIPFDASGNPTSITGSTQTSGTKLSVICGRVNSSKAAAFLNGNLESEASFTNANISTGGYLSVGSASLYGGNNGFRGPIFLAGYYRRALSNLEIKTLSKNLLKIFEPSSLTLAFNTVNSGGGTTYYSTIALASALANINTTILNAKGNLSLSETLGIIDTNNINGIAGITLGNTLTTATSSRLDIGNFILLGLSGSIATASALQATGNIYVNLSIGETLGIASEAQVTAHSTCTVGTRLEIIPIGNIQTTSACNLNVASSVTTNGGFNIAEAITLQSTTGITGNIKLEIAGTVSLTSALGQAIAQNALINGQVFLTTAIAENIVTTLLAQDTIGIGFEILSTFTGTNPAVLARIGTQEILFTIATSKLHFINSGKDTLFTSS